MKKMSLLSLVFCGLAVLGGAGSTFTHPQFVAYRSFQPELAETAAFAQMGIPLRAFGVCNTDSKLGVPYTSYPPVWLGRGKYNWKPLEDQVDDFLKISPNAQFICMVDLNTPRWLARDYLFDSFDTISHVAAIDDWRAVTREYLKAFLDHVEGRYPGRVRAYVLMAGNTTEWFEEEAGRSSRVKNAAWRKWCAARGLKHALHVPAETDLAVASFENVMYDPATEREKIDYWRFHNWIVADALLDCAHTARVETWAGVPFKSRPVAVTKRTDWTSVYAYDYRMLTLEKLRELARTAQVHFWTDVPLPVVANERFFSVHVKEGGRKMIHLPRRCSQVVELMTDRVVAEDADSFTYEFASSDTALFEMR